MFIRKWEKYSALFYQLIRFGIVGFSAACIHFTIVVLLVQNQILKPLLANFFGFLIAFQISYWGHRLWTFNVTDVMHRQALPKLFFIQVVSFLANETLFFILLSIKLPYTLALFFVLAILPIFTFISSKLWVFQ